MFIEPTFSTLLHKALTSKPDARKDKATTFVMPSLPEDGHDVAIYDDQGRELHARHWNADGEPKPTLRRDRHPAH